jgi:hypothetical protein
MKKSLIACGAVLTVGLAGAAGAQGQGGGVLVRQGSTGEVRAMVTDQTRIQGEVRMKVPLEARTVTGAPYSAEAISESVQVLPDGNRIIGQERSRVTRDGQGRVRREVEREGEVVSVTISDPVGKVSYSLEPGRKIAWKTPFGVPGIVIYDANADTASDPARVEQRRKIEQELEQKIVQLDRRRREEEAAAGAVPPPPPPPPANATSSVSVMRDRNPGWEEKVEDLAARQIEGVQAVGKRTTRTIPAGAIGNERPIVIVSEEWRSPELQVLVLTTTSDPRTGESVYKLVNINRSEPAPSLFEVPPDYTVKETGVRRMPAER